MSTDDGASWERWQSNLPVTPIYDIEVKGTDLVLGTHGRSFWIVDDLTPIHQLLDDSSEGVRLFAPRKAWRVLPDLFHMFLSGEGRNYMVSLGKNAVANSKIDATGQLETSYLDAGESAPRGALVYYTLGEATSDPDAEVALEFRDQDGDLIRRVEPKPDGFDDMTDEEKDYAPKPWIVTGDGVNRFVWDLRYEGSTKVLGNKKASEAKFGPLVGPGTYEVRLIVRYDFRLL